MNMKINHISPLDYNHVRNTFKQALRYGRYKALSFMRDEEVQFELYDLENYFFPEDLMASIKSFVHYYNNERYHESLKNVTPANVYFGNERELLRRRVDIKKKTIKERRKIYLKERIAS